MKVMVFDVGGTEIKYSVMDEGLDRTDAGSVPTPQDTQEHFLDTLYALYAPHRDELRNSLNLPLNNWYLRNSHSNEPLNRGIFIEGFKPIWSKHSSR